MTSFVRGGLKATLLCVTSMVTIAALGQANPPEAPDASAAQSAPAQSTGQSAAPGQPAAPAQLQPMPPPDPANFTAATPKIGRAHV